MRKTELVERVALKVAPFGQDFDLAQLSTFIQSGLVSAGDRQANTGQSPNYVFSSSHYRRCLQVLRFKRRGLRRDNAIRLALFLAGYSASASDIREALASECERAIKRLIAGIRTTAAETWTPPTRGQWKVLTRAFGDADERLVAAAVVPEDQFLLDQFRWMRFGHLLSGKLSNLALPEAYAHLPPGIQSSLTAANADFESLLADIEISPNAKRSKLAIAQKISQLSDIDLERGRFLFQMFRAFIYRAPSILASANLSAKFVEAIVPVCRALHSSMQQPEWRAWLFALFTIMARTELFDASMWLESKLRTSSNTEIVADCKKAWRENCAHSVSR